MGGGGNGVLAPGTCVEYLLVPGGPGMWRCLANRVVLGSESGVRGGGERQSWGCRGRQLSAQAADVGGRHLETYLACVPPLKN